MSAAEEQLAVPSECGTPTAAETLPECLNDPEVVERVNGITADQLRESLERMVTAETLPSLTRGIIRTNLEAEYELPKDALCLRRKEINVLIKALISPPPPVKQPPLKRVKTQPPPSPGATSEVAESESESGEEETTKSNSRTAKRGLRHAQSSLMTKSYFTSKAAALDCTMGPLKFTLNPREFSTGSCGWFYGNKHEMEVGDQKVTCQFTINCTVLGSKTWAKGDKNAF